MQSFSRKWNQEIENFQNQGIIEFSLKKAWKKGKLSKKKVHLDSTNNEIWRIVQLYHLV